MPRSTKPPSYFVDPDAPTPDRDQRLAERLLIDGGWPKEDAAWIAPLLLRVLPTTGADSGSWFDRQQFNVRAFASAWSLAGSDDRDAAALLVLGALTTCVHLPNLSYPQAPRGYAGVWSLPKSSWTSVVSEMQSHGVDFNRLLRHGWPDHLIREWTRDFGLLEYDRFRRLGDVLLSTGALDLARVIDVEAMVTAGADGQWNPPGASISNAAITWNDGVSWRSTRSLRTWVWYMGDEALRQALPAFTGAASESLPALATSFAEAIVDKFGALCERHFTAFDEADEAFRQTVHPYFEHLDGVLKAAEGCTAHALRPMWLLYFRMSWDSRPEACPAAIKARALAIATEDLSRLRPMLAAARISGETLEARQFSRMLPHFDQCVETLGRHGGIWRGMKPLLLGMRALGTPCVARDLRYWNEYVEDPAPAPWSAFPARLAGLVHAFAKHEQESDPELSVLREAFAAYCLGRLTDRKDVREELKSGRRARVDADMVEPSHEWRYCMVRAVMDLRANPEGRGHRALHWSSENDPHQHVRDAAGRAYETIRHARGLPERVSPRRAVMSALWWLRQAHLLGLGIQPDHDLAQRTREKELSRTKEAERFDGCAPNSD
jgi:hypothetical protein